MYYSASEHSFEVLATLDTALDKILRRAPEFYDNKEELDAFLRDPVNAKAQLLDALIAKKSSFLVDLMGDASFYANMISQGIVDAYQLATKGVLGKSILRLYPVFNLSSSSAPHFLQLILIILAAVLTNLDKYNCSFLFCS